MNNPLLIGYALVFTDVALWRFKLPRAAVVRLLIRLALFVSLSRLLFSSDLSPFTQAPYPQAVSLHVAGQVLEISWWLTGARLLSLALDTLLLPPTWRRQRLFQDVFGAIVFLAAAVAALGFVLQLPIRGLVATSGALAIVLGLAVQSTLGDVFAGIVLTSTEPYRLGDWVSIDGIDGKVLETNWRATHLLTPLGNVVIVPNAVAAKAKITNSSRPPALHGVSVTLDISPEERPATVMAALESALAGVGAILSTPAPYVHAKGTTIDSIQYEATAYVDDIAKRISVTNELYDLCYRHLEAAGVHLRPLSVSFTPPAISDSKERMLEGVELFSALSNDDLKNLASRLSRHEYEADQVVTTADVVLDSLTIVESGVLRVSAKDASGPVEVVRLGPGDTIGEAGLLAGLPARVNVSTLTKTVVYRLKKDDLTPLFTDNPEIAEKMCQLLSRRQDALGKLAGESASKHESEHSVFEWLLEKVRRLHALTS